MPKKNALTLLGTPNRVTVSLWDGDFRMLYSDSPKYTEEWNGAQPWDFMDDEEEVERARHVWHEVSVTGVEARITQRLQGKFWTVCIRAIEPGIIDPARMLVLSMPVPGLETLSDREVAIMVRLGDRQTTEEIATKMGISVSTVKSHFRRIRDKLGMKHHLELVVASARLRGL